MNTTHIPVRTAVCGGFEADYFTFGGGSRTLLILPGASLHSVMLSADAVAAAFAAFASEYTVCLFDLRRELPPGFGIRQMAQDTAALCDHLGIVRADVFGCSMGGMIAQCLAADRPDLVRSAVIASSMARNNPLSRETFSEWKRLADAGDVRGLNRSFARRVYSPEYVAAYRAAFDAQEGIGSPEEMARFSAVADALLRFEILPELGRVTCPALVLGSLRDATLSADASVEIARALGCDVFLYGGYSHAVFDEAPDFRDRLLDFFRKQDPRS